MTDTWLDKVAFNENGLAPAIAQDYKTGRILMMAWVNRESLKLSAQKNEAVYYSRSRQALWHKGETSGHTQKIKDIRLDCDSDVIIFTVEQLGGIACHTGRESCFYRTLEQGDWVVKDDVIKNPHDIYGDAAHTHE